MAITKVSQYNSTPTAVSDYQAQNAHLQAFINQLNGSVSVLNQSATTVVPTIKQGSYISMGGTAYIVDTEDYTILGSLVAGLNYIALAVSGDNLTATWTNSLSGYSWNPIYNYYSDGTNALLPYCVNYSSSNYYISQFDRTFNQGLKTTNSPTFIETTSLFNLPNISTGSYEICSKSGESYTMRTSFRPKTYFTFTAACSGTVSVDVSIKAVSTAYVVIGDTTYSTTSTSSYVTKSGTIDVIEGNSYSITFYSSSSSYLAYCNSVIVKGNRNNPIEKAIWTSLNHQIISGTVNVEGGSYTTITLPNDDENWTVTTTIESIDGEQKYNASVSVSDNIVYIRNPNTGAVFYNYIIVR